MINSLKITTMAVSLVGSLAIATTPAAAQHTAGGGHPTGGLGGGHFGAAGRGGGYVGHAGAFARPGEWHGGWGGWHGGWGGWHGGWGGWGCCGWRGLGWGWGWGPGLWAWPWYWGPSVIVDEPIYDYQPVPGYAPPPPAPPAEGPPTEQDGGYGPPPPPSGQNFNCTAWRWDATANKYIQVPAACN